MAAGPDAGVVAPALHVRAVVLPEGDLRDLYVANGVITSERRSDAMTLGTGFVLPGLVDAHCHVGLDSGGAVDEATAQAQAVADRDAGALLLRDAGSAADTRWMDQRADMPRMIRAGRHIARPERYIRNFAAEVEPSALVEEVRTQARRGDGWVKIVGDWIDRRTGDLSPLWPIDVLTLAIAAAHEEGARVTAHTFSEDAVAQLVAAGIDGIEHGTGIDDAVIEQMAARQVALVPTRLQIENFLRYADQGEAKFPVYAKHMRALYSRADTTLRRAHDAGVPIYAGTDAGGMLPHGLIAAELHALVEKVGLSTTDALAATSWGARAWLGMPDRLVEGAPADFVLYDDDPRRDTRVVAAPKRIVLRGIIVG